MKAYISHDTALSCWREHFPLDSEIGYPIQFHESQNYAFRKADILSCVPESLIEPDQPVDVLVFNASNLRRSQNVNSRIWGLPVPENAFYKDRDVCVSSPEFLFLQMASRLTTAQLIALGCELCGYYVLLPKGRQNLSAIDDFPMRTVPLTNVDAIGEFLDKVKSIQPDRGPKGLREATRALKYVIEGSLSPMETMTYMLLCLPPMLGGYGLPRPVMNEQIPLDDEAKRIARRNDCYGDLCWKTAQLDIEYYGNVHSGPFKMRDDAGRILGIEHMGWKVITLTCLQVLDIERFEVVAREAAKRLRKRLYPRVVGATQERCRLHDELESWMFK